VARDGKESLNFSFPFNVPNGDLSYDFPFGAAQPEKDQLPSACKNWLAVNRWVDVANDDFGVTWVTLDAPLIEPGYLSATLLNSQTNPDVWRKKIDRTQRFYSWAMNNHWGTNYRAYQEGPTLFRFVLRPHRRKTNNAEATRFAVACSQPLLITDGTEAFKPPVTVDSREVIVSALKPSNDGKALIIRLFGASGESHSVKLKWPNGEPKSLTLSNTSEQPGAKVSGDVSVPGYGIVTLRAEF
jgi:alpha-mannosidase